MRLSGTKTGSANQYNGLGDQLYDLGGARPTLDLNFASNGSLVDSVTGKTLVTHTRASNATYVDGDGIIKDAVTNYLVYSEEFDQNAGSSTEWGHGPDITVTANDREAPNGTLTADKIVQSGSGAYLFQSRAVGTIASTSFTASLYVYAESEFDFTIRVRGNGSTQEAENFTVSTVANQWTKVSATKAFTASADGTTAVVSLYTDVIGQSNNRTVWFWGAQLEESSTAGEYVKTTSTINSAPRFDHKVTRTTTNLLTYSENFSNPVWSPARVTVTQNVATSPDGTVSAEKVIPSTIDNSFKELQQNFSATSGTTYTFSKYVKADGYNFVQIIGNGGTFGHFYVNYDLSTGVETDFNAGTSTVVGRSIENVGNGWYRISASVTALATASGRMAVNIIPNSTSGRGDSWSGDGTSGVLMWGAQTEANSDVGPYVKTTGAAATKVDSESLGLLVEEERTNLVTYSQDFTQSVWQNSNNRATCINTTGIDDPSGGTTASRWSSGTASNQELIYRATATAMSGVHTKSIWIRRVSGDGNVAFYIGDLVPNSVSSQLDAVPVGTWVRCTITRTVTSGTRNYIYVFPGTNSQPTTIDIWGDQIEAGSFPTSYIRTEGSTATRSADVASIEGNDFGTFNLVQYSEEFDRWSLGVGATVKPNLITAPDETQTADLLIEDTSTGQHSRYVATTVIGTQTFSVHAKASSSSRLLRLINYNSTDGSLGTSYFNLETGQVLSGSGTITSVGNGWYRCSITYTTTVTSHAYITLSPSVGTFAYTGDGTSGLYLWGAQIEESSTATPYVKSDVTWTSRATNATYYDYTGTLRKSSYNQLLKSEEFGDSAWINFGTTEAAVSITNPAGGSTAFKLSETAATQEHGIYQTTSTSGDNTFTVFAKAAERRYIVLRRDPASLFAVFDLQTGTVTHTDVGVTASMTDSGNGWYRCSMTCVNTGNTVIKMAINGTGIVSQDQYQGDGTSGLYIWGAQLETGPYAGDYAKTEASAASSARNVAFLPDGSGNFVSAGELLLEDAGTNLITYSERFGQWVNNACPVTADATTAPDGTLTADKLVPNTVSGNHFRFLQIGTSSGVNQIMSVYAKAAEYDRIQLVLGANGYGSSVKAKYNLTTGTSQITTFGTNTTANIEPVGNGWYRCILSSEATASANPQHQVRVLNENGDFSFVGDDVKGVFVWGAQVEQNPYATSYIPTYGSTATRAADVSSSSSNTFGNSFYNQTEGTVFNSFVALDPTILGFSSVFNDGTNSNRLGLQTTATGFGRAVVSVGGVDQSLVGTGGVVAGDINRLALHYALNDFAISKNGEAVSTDVSGSIPTVNKLDIGQAANTAYLNNSISRLTVWPTRLSNDTLQTITE